MLAEGVERSPTSQRLVHRIRYSDVVVYVDMDAFEQRTVEAALVFVGSAQGTPYVQVWLNPKRIDDELVVKLGHELEHAAAVADAPEVVCQKSFTAVWRREGESRQPGRFDTGSAARAERRIREELRAPRVSGHVAPNADRPHD